MAPDYPDLLDRLVRRAEEKQTELVIKYYDGTWQVYFGDDALVWRTSLESAALQALAKGEER